MRTVLFVCTGNTCRSPMAEGIARHLQRNGHLPDDLFFASAGTAAKDGDPASEETRLVLERLGEVVDGSSKRLTASMVRRANLVVGMTRSHVAAAQALVAASPDLLARIVPLDDGEDIADPIGSPQRAYDEVGRQLLELIPKRLEEMLTP